LPVAFPLSQKLTAAIAVAGLVHVAGASLRLTTAERGA
jgi:hypothetical protein